MTRFRLRRLLAITRKEVVQLKRDKRSLVFAFVLPLFLLIIFGYAISWDVRNIAMVVLDYDHSQASRAIVDAMRSSSYFVVVDEVARPADVDRLIDRGAATLAITIPPDFAKKLRSGTARIQAIADGSDANTATIALGYAESVVLNYSASVLLESRVRFPLTAQSRVWYNEELRSRNMIVPGLVAVIMSIIAAILTSLTIAREWDRGTMEQLASTPVTPFEVVIGKLIPYAVIGLIDIAMITTVGVLLFRVPFRGSIVLLFAMSLLFLLGALGVGIFISAVARSQLVATQAAMVVTYLPSFLLSGFIYTIDNMPPVLRVVTYLVPARYFLVVTRGIFLKGTGLSELWLQASLMIAFAATGLGLSMWRFRKVIE
jgi:ABC-2 type transport system permease protein